MSAEILSGVGAARRAILTGTLGAQQQPNGGGGSLSSSVITPPFAAYVLSRIGFVHVEGTLNSVAYFNSLGANDDARLTAYVDEQLNPPRDGNGWIIDPDADARLANPAYVTLNKTFDQLWNDYEVNGNVSGQPYVRDYPIREGERAVFVRAIYGRWQLVEQLADFWHNHFNVYGYDRYAAPTWTSWDRDVIRKNMLGNFRQMLQATFEAPAMLYFLDNFINRAPSFNENYAREICELHTLGAINYLGPELQQNQVPLIPAGEDGAGMPVGYVDADVYEMARALTGWTFGNGQNGTAYDGHQTFITSWHDIGQKTVLGAFVPANTPPATEIATFLDRIAKHPGTGRHIALKLAQRFISDDPPQAVVDEAAHVFWQNIDAPDQLKQVVRTILLHDAGPGSFRDIANFGNKVKRPFHAVTSGLRSSGFIFTLKRNIDDGSPSSDRFMDRYRRTGERPFDWRAPNGFPDASDAWMGSTALVHAWRTLDWAIDENLGDGQTPLVLVLAITQAILPDRHQHTPNTLANVWMTQIFGWKPDPTNGWIGTDLHTKVRDFMCRNTDTLNMWPPDAPIGTGEAGNTQGIETNSSPNYWYNRLRGMVDVILFSPQFMVR